MCIFSRTNHHPINLQLFCLLQLPFSSNKKVNSFFGGLAVGRTDRVEGLNRLLYRAVKETCTMATFLRAMFPALMTRGYVGQKRMGKNM